MTDIATVSLAGNIAEGYFPLCIMFLESCARQKKIPVDNGALGLLLLKGTRSASPAEVAVPLGQLSAQGGTKPIGLRETFQKEKPSLEEVATKIQGRTLKIISQGPALEIDS